MSRNFSAYWGWSLATVVALVVDGLVWHRLVPRTTVSPRLVVYLAAVFLLGRLSASVRWRWVWALAGLIVVAAEIGMDFTGVALWVWVAGWRRVGWKEARGHGTWAVSGWLLHVFAQALLLPVQGTRASISLTVSVLALTGIGPAILWLTVRPHRESSL